MIYLCGDTHIPLDVAKLNTTNFPIQKSLTRDDYVIVLGDFGLYLNRGKEFENWYKWFQEKPFTTLWLDGNHSNPMWIKEFPVSDWHGGKAQIDGNIIHLRRGNIYDIDQYSIFVMGGAKSIDSHLRIEGVSWFREEEPATGEMLFGLDNLERHNNTVDIILTHAAPRSLVHEMFNFSVEDSATSSYLDEIYQRVNFRTWAFGHYHEDKDLGRFHCLYHRIIPINELL